MPDATTSRRKQAAAQRSTHRRGEHAEAILAAAQRLIARQGDFTTQELIEEAGVALRTFYHHFPSKDQLLIRLIGHSIELNARALEAEITELDDPVSQLEHIVTSPLRSMETGTSDLNPRFVTAQHWRLHEQYPAEIAAASRPFTDLVQRTLEAGRDRGVLAPRSPERDAWLIMTTVTAVFHHFAFDDADPARATAADDLWAYCLAAVGG